MLTSLTVNEVDAIVTLMTMRMNATRPATGIDDTTIGNVGMMTANAATMIGTGSGIENVIATIAVVTITTWTTVDMAIAEPKGIAGAILDVATHEGTLSPRVIFQWLIVCLDHCGIFGSGVHFNDEVMCQVGIA
jgi:hypothetical protein